jgi:hypothetical protein
MKRILSACLEQTVLFKTEEESHTYINNLKKNGVTCKIVETQTHPDNSVAVKLIRDYNKRPVGDYFD